MQLKHVSRNGEYVNAMARAHCLMEMEKQTNDTYNVSPIERRSRFTALIKASNNKTTLVIAVLTSQNAATYVLELPRE